MRKVPVKKTKKQNKFVFVFVIILILIIVFAASFIISFNVMSGGNNKTQQQQEEYQQPTDMLDGEKTEADQIADLKKENQKLKNEVSSLQDENAVLRSELQTLTATLENQNFVKENASSSDDKNTDTPTEPETSIPNTSETGL